MEKALYFVTGSYKIFGDGLVLYGDIMYSKAKQDNGLAGAACHMMMRIRELEKTGEDRDSAVEAALDELCLCLTETPDGIARRLLVTVLLRAAIKASVGVQGLAYTVAVLVDMTDNLTGMDSTKHIN